MAAGHEAEIRKPGGTLRQSALVALSCAFGFGLVVGLITAVAIAGGAAFKWDPKVEAGDILSGILNVLSILALAFIVDAARDKRNKERQLIETWVTDALYALRDAHAAYEDGPSGPLSAESFAEVKRNTRKLFASVSTLEESLKAWQYDLSVLGAASTLAAAVQQYEDAVGEKNRPTADVRNARAAQKVIKTALLDMFARLRQ